MEDNLLPIVMRIDTRTIAMDLVTVKPMSVTKNESILSEVKQINRNLKIDSIVNNVDYKEMKVEDHPEYNPPYMSYLDMVYGGTPSFGKWIK